MRQGAGSDAQAREPDVDLAYPLNQGSPHAAAALASGLRVRFYLINALGLEAEAVRALLPTMRTVMAEERLVPVVLTDLTEYTMFREAAVIFEGIPPLGASALLAPQFDWQARRRERLDEIRAKWRPVGEAVLGEGIAGNSAA